MAEIARDPRVRFIGQGVACPGTFMSETLVDVPDRQKIEFPVAEELQLGVSIGMALDGLIPVSVFPRWNFLLSATSQLVNHLDKMRAHVIVRVGIGSTAPLYPGPQHVGDFTEAFRLMMQNTPVIRIRNVQDIETGYAAALRHKAPTVLVEDAALYGG